MGLRGRVSERGGGELFKAGQGSIPPVWAMQYLRAPPRRLRDRAKGNGSRLLRKSIDAVMAGQYWIERESVSDSARVLAKRPRGVSREGSNKSWRLTPREEQITAEVVSGKTTNEIAQTIGLSAQTVKHHLTGIFDKVGVFNRLDMTFSRVEPALALL